MVEAASSFLTRFKVQALRHYREFSAAMALTTIILVVLYPLRLCGGRDVSSAGLSGPHEIRSAFGVVLIRDYYSCQD